MTKKKVWTAGCMVLMVFLVCTVLSIHIQRLMRIDVEVTGGISNKEDEAMQTAKIPLSCYQTEEPVVFCVEEREGLFGTEQIAVKKEVYILYEEGDMAVIPGGEIRNAQGKLLQFISQSVWQVKDGETVVVVENLKNASDIAGLRKQSWILGCLIVMLPVGVWIMVKSSRNLLQFQAGDWKQGMKGSALFTVWLVILFLLLGKLDIPRKFLPPEYILDIGFYMSEI